MYEDRKVNIYRTLATNTNRRHDEAAHADLHGTVQFLNISMKYCGDNMKERTGDTNDDIHKGAS